MCHSHWKRTVKKENVAEWPKKAEMREAEPLAANEASKGMSGFEEATAHGALH